jgi:multidrug resistance efflux pump
VDDLFACQQSCGRRFVSKCIPAIGQFQDKEVEIAEKEAERAQTVGDSGVMKFREFKRTKDKLERVKREQKSRNKKTRKNSQKAK